MTIRSTVMEQSAVVEMAGTMAANDFSRLHRHLVDLLRARRKKIVLDFNGVDHVSYRSASSLAGEFELVRSYDGDLRVAGLSRYVRDILALAGLSDLPEANTPGPETLDAAQMPHAS